MIRILVFGTGSTSDKVELMLNMNVEIIAYVDNDRIKWGKIKKGIEIVSPNTIYSLTYDYIVIASQFSNEICLQLIEMGIKKEKVFNFYAFLDIKFNYIQATISYIDSKWADLARIIITGLSYSRSSISERVLKEFAINLAFASQDLYYDYQLFRYIFQRFKDRLKNLRYTIIGMSYYSFQYDLSLSSLKDKILPYYYTFGLKHNFKGNLLNLDRINMENDEQLFKLLFNEKSYLTSFSESNCDLSNMHNKFEIGKRQALLDSNKNYPETVKENKKILIEYIKLLRENGIRPIIVISPASKYYTSNFSKKIENEFHSIIKEIRIEHDFQYIDYFRSQLFNDEDFADVSHLNSKGAEKFTKILNEVIEW